ncbi:ABC transporter permease [Primorskyibacter aestuariivivens]|uniref:ABC transporter permease n=1 Tax=Primorskyibacter aestuariivivens TaxID=1888912 RepID=UPI002301836E|nr:ABC transporter permease [Primorskyibacter aestuariivivens]MDA7428604.1 ABC transporter permease [Primorskyibacter aestuariivivens]
MNPLDRKLLRDLWRLKGQAIAIAAVIAVGVLMLVMMTGLAASLSETRDAYYERYRLADVFAPVARAPERIGDRLGNIGGVATVQTRVVGRALITIPGRTLPVQARALSLPDRGAPRLNDVYLTDGRMPAPGHPDEILLLRSFARAHDLTPGDTIRTTMNGARRSFDIVGLAQSPEFLYTTAPGEIVPDDARFGVIWMSRSSLAAAYDMAGAFNEALLGLTRDALEAEVLATVDRLLEPYGGAAAYARAEQFSNRFVTEEINGIGVTALFIPPVFLAVAAFLLYIVISRLVQAEREEIGLLKAFGYTNSQVGTHYFKLILVIAVGGALAGCFGGIAAGRAMTELYTIYYKFPFLVFRLEPLSFVVGVSVSILSASTGGLFVMRRIFALAPAEAMRPAAPPNYSRSGRIGQGLAHWLDQPSRMVLRRITRQPIRMAGAVVGIACGMALSSAMTTLYAGFDRTIDLTFSVIDRSDVAVTFTHPVSEKTLFELARLDGVQRVEPVRHVAAVLRHGLRTHRGSVTGLPPDPELNRALDADAVPIRLPPDGVILSDVLARKLAISPGQVLTVDVREGRRPTLHIPVAGTAESLLGAPAYMNIAALNRAMREPRRVSGVNLIIDEAQNASVHGALQNMPAVAGVSLKSEARAAFETLMNEGAGATRYVMGAIAFVITFGIVYNAARVALAERARDLASLRVIGFTRGETAFVLLGELAVVTLVALPLGAALGYVLSFAIAAGFSTDLYQIPILFDPASYGLAALVVLGAALVSGLVVKRDLDRTDLVATLKTRE